MNSIDSLVQYLESNQNEIITADLYLREGLLLIKHGSTLKEIREVSAKDIEQSLLDMFSNDTDDEDVLESIAIGNKSAYLCLVSKALPEGFNIKLTSREPSNIVTRN